VTQTVDTTPPAHDAGLLLAVVWLAMTTLVLIGSSVFFIFPAIGANVALFTVPAFASGWGGVAAAWRTRRRERRVALLAPLGGLAGGFVLGVVLTLIVYAIVWPDLR
jgi:hypothetical protein